MRRFMMSIVMSLAIVAGLTITASAGTSKQEADQLNFNVGDDSFNNVTIKGGANWYKIVKSETVVTDIYVNVKVDVERGLAGHLKVQLQNSSGSILGRDDTPNALEYNIVSEGRGKGTYYHYW